MIKPLIGVSTAVLSGLLVLSPVSAAMASTSSSDPLPSHFHVSLLANNDVKPDKVYKVKQDDSLFKIANKLNLNWRRLYCENKKLIGKNPDLIMKGMRLVIGKGKYCQLPSQAPVVTTAQVTTLGTNATPVKQPVPSTPVNTGGFGSFQACVIQAESGGDPRAYNASSGASGLYGFLLSTWDSLGLGYPGGAYTAPVSVQNQGFSILYARDGTAPWAPYDGC